MTRSRTNPITNPDPRLLNRPRPPADLVPAAREIWITTVSSLPPEHFVPSDLLLLSFYCRTAAGLDVARTHVETDGHVIAGKASLWIGVASQEARTLVALASKLRLTPMQRWDRTAVGARMRVRPDKWATPDNGGINPLAKYGLS